MERIPNQWGKEVVVCSYCGEYCGNATTETPDYEKCGQICAIIVPGPGKYLGCFCRDVEYCIPWCDIVRIGPDIVLVNLKDEMRHKI